MEYKAILNGGYFEFFQETKKIYLGKIADGIVYPGKLSFLLTLDNQVIYRICFRGIFKIRLEFKKGAEVITVFRTSGLKRKYFFNYKGDTYEIMPHKKRKTSYFKNGVQIGYHEFPTVERGSKQTYTIYLNHNENPILFFCYLIGNLTFRHMDADSSISINSGRLFEVAPFDKNWSPN